MIQNIEITILIILVILWSIVGIYATYRETVRKYRLIEDYCTLRCSYIIDKMEELGNTSYNATKRVEILMDCKDQCERWLK